MVIRIAIKSEVIFLEAISSSIIINLRLRLGCLLNIFVAFTVLGLIHSQLIEEVASILSYL
jgi:hypothetical protein